MTIHVFTPPKAKLFFKTVLMSACFNLPDMSDVSTQRIDVLQIEGRDERTFFNHGNRSNSFKGATGGHSMAEMSLETAHWHIIAKNPANSGAFRDIALYGPCRVGVDIIDLVSFHTRIFKGQSDTGFY